MDQEKQHQSTSYQRQNHTTMSNATKTNSDEIPTAPSTTESLALGDASYVDEDWEGALTAYTTTLALLEDQHPTKTHDTLAKFRALSHRAAALAKLQRHQEALEDTVAADCCLSEGIAGLRPGETELCLRRQGLAAWELELWREALLAFQKAQQLAQLNHSRQGFPYADWIQRCEEKLILSTKSLVEPAPVPSVDVVVDVDAPSSSSSLASSSLKRKPSDISAPKYQYYQNDKIMTISILEAGVSESDLTVQYDTDHLIVQLRKSRGGYTKEFTVVKGPLHAEIVPNQCKVTLRDEKVLIKLRKKEPGEWYELFGKEKKTTKSISSTTEKKASNPSNVKESETATASSVPAADVGSAQRARPYASERNWDSIEKQIAEEEEKEKPQGDDAMNKLFQQLYANADPDTRRAMIKSYQTSGGTVLSTNWDEVQKTDYEKERTAPDGVEWKNWEGEKLPMKKED